MIEEILETISIFTCGLITVVWVFNGVEILFKVIVVLLLWMIFYRLLCLKNNVNESK